MGRWAGRAGIQARLTATNPSTRPAPLSVNVIGIATEKFIFFAIRINGGELREHAGTRGKMEERVQSDNTQQQQQQLRR